LADRGTGPQESSPRVLTEFEEESFCGIKLHGVENRYTTAREQVFSLFKASLAERTSSMKQPAVAATHIADFKNWPDFENKESTIMNRFKRI
jgi:uncharacterized sporulation protein YeaH/YhbH (DUF444 family)